MALRIRLLPNSPVALFAQIVQQVRQAVAQGALRPGDQLPTVRDLAEELLVNPNTVAKSYQELESAGVLITRRGAGTFVASVVCALAPQERERIVTEKMRECLTEAVHLELPKKYVLRRFGECAERFQWPPP